MYDGWLVEIRPNCLSEQRHSESQPNVSLVVLYLYLFSSRFALARFSTPYQHLLSLSHPDVCSRFLQFILLFNRSVEVYLSCFGRQTYFQTKGLLQVANVYEVGLALFDSSRRGSLQNVSHQPELSPFDSSSRDCSSIASLWSCHSMRSLSCFLDACSNLQDSSLQDRRLVLNRSFPSSLHRPSITFFF